MPKKTDPILLTIYIIIGLAITYFGAAFGAAMDLAADENGKIDFSLINIDETINNTELLIENVSDVNTNCFQVAAIAAFIYFVFIATKYIKRLRLHRKGVEHGSARWANDKEKKVLADKKNKTQYIVLIDENGKARIDEYGKEMKAKYDNNLILTSDILMSLNTRQHRENLNILVVGGSGSGKSRFFVKPNILQLNTSYILTDPKGEILQSTGKLLTEAGYEVRVFNLINMENSHNYNPFAYVYNYDGTLNQSYVLKMINVLMKNTKKDGTGGGDQFWEDSATALLTAIAFLLLEEGEKSELNFAGVLKMLKLVQIDMNDNTAKSPLDLRFDKIAEASPNSMAVSYYTDFKKAPPETAMSIVMSCNVRLQAFNIKTVSDLTHTDTINLSEIGDRKTALFIIIPASDTTFNFLAAMMYTQLFDCLYDRANFQHGGRLPVHVRCILDEFANVGTIPEFDKLLATMRSMEISANIILQSISQLKAMYEKTWEGLKGNCDSFLFLGGSEETTVDSISKALGKETIDLKSSNKTKSHKNNSTAENNSILARELLQPDELARMKIEKCVCMVRSFFPFFSDKYDITKHPNYKYIEDADEANKYDYRKIKTLTNPPKPVTDEEKENRYNELAFEPSDGDILFGEIQDTENEQPEKVNINPQLKKCLDGKIERTNGKTVMTSKSVVENGELSRSSEPDENSDYEYEDSGEYEDNADDEDIFNETLENPAKAVLFEDNCNFDDEAVSSILINGNINNYKKAEVNENELDLTHQITSKKYDYLPSETAGTEKETLFGSDMPITENTELPESDSMEVISGFMAISEGMADFDIEAIY